VNPLLTDAATLDWVRRTAAGARYITSVCTGALLLGAAGLLEGKRATTHWASHRFLEDFGAVAVRERVVIDGDLITGGGVTAGMDFAFAVVEEIFDRDEAALAMLALEYDPAPPFPGGSPDNTDAELVARYRDRSRDSLESRAQQVSRAASLLRG
jgi:cyclohexyl-isocyanide hydratase